MSIADIFSIQHEVQFTPQINEANLSMLRHTIRSECSWLAAPFTQQLQDWGQKIIHLVRHPIKVINSLIGIDFWNGEGHKHYRDFAVRYTPGGIASILTPIEKSMLYWLKWNKQLSDKNFPRLRLEDIANKPQLNARKRANILSWDDLPQNNSLSNDIQTLARTYGYV